MPAPTNNKISGKQKSLTFGGVRIYTTSISASVNPKFADTTDDNDYDSGTDLVYPSRVRTSAPVEFSVDGFYYKNSTPSAVVSKAFDATGPSLVAFSVATGYPHFSGYYDLSDLQVQAESTDVTKVSFKLMSNSVVGINS